MCDYSLHHKASRPAKVGEKLVTTKFSDSASRGFTAPGDANTAVCVLPGSELAFSRRVQVVATTPFEALANGLRRVIGVPPASGDITATFIQINKDNATSHHDALEFADGSIVRLTDLEPGQQATVLTLPAKPVTMAERETQRRAAFV